jgi:hypothetical protein
MICEFSYSNKQPRKDLKYSIQNAGGVVPINFVMKYYNFSLQIHFFPEKNTKCNHLSTLTL